MMSEVYVSPLDKLRGVVSSVDCASDSLALQRIQTRLAEVAKKDSDQDFLYCARIAYSRPDVLFEAFYTDDMNALEQVKSWIPEPLAQPEQNPLETRNEGTNPSSIDESTCVLNMEALCHKVEQSVYSDLCGDDEDTPNTSSAVHEIEAQDNQSTLETTKPAMIITDACSQQPSRSRRADDVEKKRNRIKKAIANNLRDSFF